MRLDRRLLYASLILAAVATCLTVVITRARQKARSDQPEAEGALPKAGSREKATAIGGDTAGPQGASAAQNRSGRRPPSFVQEAEGAVEKPGVEKRAIEIVGSLTEDDVVIPVMETIPDIKTCYDQLVGRNPRAAGELLVRFTVRAREGKGRVSEATIVPQQGDAAARELIHPATEQCVLNALAKAVFNAPTGGSATVTFPFTFATGGGARP